MLSHLGYVMSAMSVEVTALHGPMIDGARSLSRRITRHTYNQDISMSNIPAYQGSCHIAAATARSEPGCKWKDRKMDSPDDLKCWLAAALYYTIRDEFGQYI